MHSQRHQRQQAEDAHGIVAEQTLPLLEGQSRIEDQVAQQEEGASCQQYGGNALRHRVVQTATRQVGDVGYHMHTPSRTIRTAATTTSTRAPSRPRSSPAPTPASISRWRTPATRRDSSRDSTPHNTSLAIGFAKQALTCSKPLSELRDVSSIQSRPAMAMNRMTPEMR